MGGHRRGYAALTGGVLPRRARPVVVQKCLQARYGMGKELLEASTQEGRYIQATGVKHPMLAAAPVA